MIQHKRNMDLDAKMVLQCSKYGRHALPRFAFFNRHIFSSPDDALDRANWLKNQSEDYINQVSERVIELERKEGQPKEER